jgi:6-phosphogluconolactonase
MVFSLGMKTFKPVLAVTVAVGLACVLGLSGLFVPGTHAAEKNQYLVYIGTYTGAKSKGIYVARFDSASGKLSEPELAAQTVHPTFLALHPNRRFLYAANEIGNFAGTKSGAVSAFAIDAATGKLTLINQQSSGGNGPCHLAVDHTGKKVLVANYGGGSIEVLPVKDNGGLGEATAFIQHQGSSVNKQRQEGPHAHFITTDPANRFALTCDLGLDKVLVYRLDAAKGTLAPNDPAAATLEPGSGPRHLAFHPDGRWVYVINELASTMTVFGYAARRGALTTLQTVSTLPDGFTGKNNSTAEVQAHPSGQFVYGSNRGHDSIAVFAVDKQSGRLSLVQHQSTLGKMPRHFTLDPAGNWLLAENQQTDNMAIFSVDKSTGRLAPTGQVLSAPAPVCALFVPAEGR